VLQRAYLLVAWALYLSICCVGGDFLYFQWDALLLETGLCAFFFAARGGGSMPTCRASPR